MAKTSRSLPQTLRHYLANPLALGYLGVVLAVCLWVAADAFFASSSGDASFAGLWAVLVTAPTSLLIPFTGPVGLTAIPIGAVTSWRHRTYKNVPAKSRSSRATCSRSRS
jgi:hypothetical protein